MKNILRKLLGIALVLAFLFTGMAPLITDAEVESLTQSSVLITDSAPEATADYTFSFTTGSEIPSDGDIRITFPDTDWLGDLSESDITCPTDSTAKKESDNIYCEVDSAATLPADSYEISVDGVTNPAKVESEGVADTYTVDLATRDDADEKIENGQVMVAIVEAITVRATVNASLTFDVTGVNNGEEVNTETTDVDTEATRIPFGILEPDVPKVAAQDLAVATNASDGFTVTIFQDGNMVNADGDEISSFKDNTPVATSAAESWASPSATLDEHDTYGHFGFTSEDTQVSDSCLTDPGTPSEDVYFDGSVWAGFDNTDVEEVMCHVGPSDGETEHKGTTRIGFQAEVSALQPAGEYKNTLTYIATPTF